MGKLNTSKTEYWDLYRMDGRFDKVIPSRGYDIPADRYHMTVEVIPTDLKGHILVTQRSMEKKQGAGKFEFPAGSVLSEEKPFVAARRELLEETGLKADHLQKLCSYIEPRIQRTVYVAYIPDLCTAPVVLQEGETMSYRILTFQQWLELVAQEKFETSKFRNYTAAMFQKLEQWVGPAPSEEHQPVPKRALEKDGKTFLDVKRPKPQEEQYFDTLPSGMTFEDLFENYDEDVIL